MPGKRLYGERKKEDGSGELFNVKSKNICTPYYGGGVIRVVSNSQDRH